MEAKNDVPPTHTVAPIEAPPPSAQPTSAQLKADIDSGRAGDKVDVFDPGLSPLGTDDEAAGTPPTPHRVRMARAFETARRWVDAGRPRGYVHQAPDGALVAFLSFIVLVGAAMVGGVSMVVR